MKGLLVRLSAMLILLGAAFAAGAQAQQPIRIGASVSHTGQYVALWQKMYRYQYQHLPDSRLQSGL